MHRGRTLDGLQPAKHRLTVVFLKELHIGVDRELAPAKLQQKSTFGLTNAAGRTVTQITANQHHISLTLVSIELFARRAGFFGRV